MGQTDPLATHALGCKLSHMTELPKSHELVEPLLKFLASHGQVASNKEIADALVKDLVIPEHLLAQIHSGTRTEFEYRLAWARTKAKSAGLITSPARERWELSRN